MASAFKKPSDNRSSEILLMPPATVHTTSYLSGGLRQVYENVRERKVRVLHEFGQYTDKDGRFCPELGMPFLALQYRFLQILGQGQSSVIIKAQDTFREDRFVCIKVLHTVYFPIGGQEADIMLELNQHDPCGYVPIVRLLNTFSFDDHYCLTFDLLHSDQITDHFRKLHLCKRESLQSIREVTAKLLSVIGFLFTANIIHADLKPDNILLSSEKDLSTLKVIDFGNAIRCIEEELTLYHSDFELQALVYRAPEVIVGLEFGFPVDVWSLGCIVAELYSGRPLFYGRNKEEVLEKITSILGPLPEEYRRGKFASQYSRFFTGQPFSKYETLKKLIEALGAPSDWPFVIFVSRFFTYDPSERITVTEASREEFLAPVVSFRYLSTASINDITGKVNQTGLYPRVLLTKDVYPFEPEGCRALLPNNTANDEQELEQPDDWRVIEPPYGQDTPPHTSPERTAEDDTVWTKPASTAVENSPSTKPKTSSGHPCRGPKKKCTRRRSSESEDSDEPCEERQLKSIKDSKPRSSSKSKKKKNIVNT